MKAAAVTALFSLSPASTPQFLTAVLALAMSSICRCRSSISTSIALRAFTAAAQVNSDSSSWTQSHPRPRERRQPFPGDRRALQGAHRGEGAQALSFPPPCTSDPGTSGCCGVCTGIACRDRGVYRAHPSSPGLAVTLGGMQRPRGVWLLQVASPASLSPSFPRMQEPLRGT